MKTYQKTLQEVKKNSTVGRISKIWMPRRSFIFSATPVADLQRPALSCCVLEVCRQKATRNNRVFAKRPVHPGLGQRTLPGASERAGASCAAPAGSMRAALARRIRSAFSFQSCCILGCTRCRCSSRSPPPKTTRAHLAMAAPLALLLLSLAIVHGKTRCIFFCFFFSFC